MKTLSLHSKVAASITIDARTAAAAVNGTGVAMGAFRSAMAVIHVGTVTDGTHTFAVQDSDDNSSYTDVADAYLEGTEPAVTSTESDTVTVIGYKGTRKYLRVKVTTAGATTGGIFGATIILADPTRSPVSR